MSDITDLCEEFLDEKIDENQFRRLLVQKIEGYEVEVAECLKNYLR